VRICGFRSGIAAVQNGTPRESCSIPPGQFERGVFHVEHFFNCPYCGEQISMVVDLSVHRQTYIEDCEVCCKPIEVNCTVQDDTIAAFRAKTLE